ncbi:PEP-CTERM sorting domain-containing protein [Akkermansiaceae bacterium]|nr:PEP-CTERM sorting domain-containing protein [Akkermansiaceae bacterium]
MKFSEQRNSSVSRRAMGALLSLSALSAVHGASLVPNYLDGANEGFNDATLGAQRQAAFEYALGLWSNVLGESYGGETVVVDTQFNPLGGSPTSATLGFAGPLGSGFVSNPANNPTGNNNVFFPGALRNHLNQTDSVDGSEITSTFNSDVDGAVVLGSTTFYYGTDDNAPSGTTDFVSTALHEIGHGLGWTGTLDVDTTNGTTDGSYINGTLFNSYDFYVQRTSDGVALHTLGDADRFSAATGDNISWSGALGVAANSGTAPDLFAPTPSEPGSSYSHLDEGDFPTELMSPQATPGTGHTLSPLTLAILEDQGWTITAVPEPGSALLLSLAGLFLARRRR